MSERHKPAHPFFLHARTRSPLLRYVRLLAFLLSPIHIVAVVIVIVIVVVFLAIRRALLTRTPGRILRHARRKREGAARSK